MTSSAHDTGLGVEAIDVHIGYRLRMRRRLRLMSEQRLAEALGIERACLVDMEAGRKSIDATHLLHAADILGVHPRYFFQEFDPRRATGAPRPHRVTVRDVDLWFKESVAPHERLFLKLAHRLVGNFDTARDLVHDAYAAVLAAERWRSVSNAKAYVGEIVSNLARDHLKRGKIVPMDPYADIDQFGLTDRAPDASKTVEDRERLRIVMAAIDKLPRQCRQVFIMRRIDDISPREIARKLGLAVGTVEQHLIQGMSALHRHLETHRKAVHLKVWLANEKPKETALPLPKDSPR